MDASVANRMQVKRSARTSQPVRCNLRSTASVTSQYRAFDRTRHPPVWQLPDRGIPMRHLEDDNWLTEELAAASPSAVGSARDDCHFGFANGLCLSIVDAVNFSSHGRHYPSARNA